MTPQEPPKGFEAAMTALKEDKAIELMQDTMENFLAAASVEAVYAEPIEKEEALIVPAAEVVSALGFGVGSGYGGSPERDEAGGSGGGGGGRVFSRPVAVIVASREGVRVEPVLDLTKIALAALTASAFMVSMFLRLLSPRKALKELEKGDWG